MNRRFVTPVCVALLGLAAISFTSIENSQARGREDRRQTRQSARIHEGRATGDLTRAEMRQVHRSGKAVRHAEKRFENNDGQIGEKEAKVLENMQDARSKQIYRLKHNDRVRGDGAVIANPQPSQPADAVAPAAN